MSGEERVKNMLDYLLNVDESQLSSLKDQLIQVDENDVVLGSISKIDAHKICPKSQLCPLHRAFSLFLFDNSNPPLLLIHKRSGKKITFPYHWTNSCCSHPLYNESELEAKDLIGIKRAIVRRTAFELNIDLDISDLHYITRIHYSSGNELGPSVFGEHEIDYVFFAQKTLCLEDICPNPDEVSKLRLVTLDSILEMADNFESGGEYILTPWFYRISKTYLAKWWPANKISEVKVLKPDAIKQI